MLSGLVDSRLVIPPPPPRHVSRRRLLAALDDAADAALVLLSAGPGSGKTVLLAEWARQTPEHVAWLCPTPDDDDPGRFRALLTAAFGIPPEVAPDPVLAEARPVDFVHWLRGRLPTGRGRLVLAVDDGHVLTSPGVIALLDKLVSCGRPQLHVVLAARHDPPLPLHRYRLAGQLREFRMPQLAMTPGEVREVLAAHQVTLPPPALRALAARTEGLAAGVRLAGMRMEHVRGPAGLVAELSFDYGSAGEYFLAEVLGRLPEPVRRLLVETSFLDTVTAPLAAAVTGLEGAGEMLAGLAHGNWFVIPVDAAGTRFRYHRLFAEVLRDLLGRHGRHRLAELAARAAAFFAEDGDVEQALYWAARAGDSRQAAALLVGGGLCQAFAHHRPVPRAELAGVLPAPARPASPGNGGPPGPHPEIALAAVALRAATGGSAVPAQEATAQEATAQELAQALAAVPLETRQSGPARQTAVLVELMLAMRSADSRAVDHAASRLVGGSSPDGPHSGVLRGAVLLAQASAHFWAGAQDDVDVLLSQALAESERCGLVRVQADVLGMMACVATYRGRPGHADEAALQADRLLRGRPGLRTPTALRLAAVIRSVLRAD
ncbi:MAG TPA: hypothetical protein VHF26_07950, partial [Trebonia sp.]|nr:hypothetical protein [Trebonia sp.]